MKEQLYQDFVTKLLPQIQQGLTITKDYFLDLFSRYIKYLIISDSIGLILGIFLLGVSIFCGLKALKLQKEGKREEVWQTNRNEGIIFILCTIVMLFIIFGTGLFFISLGNLIKDIYIPEVRIYQEFKDYNSK